MNLAIVQAVAGLGAVGLTLVIRAIPPFSGWNERGVKPWACDLCMSFWMSALCLFIGALSGKVDPLDAFYVWMPSFVLAYGAIQRINPPPMGGPPIDPPSRDGSGEQT